MPPPRKYLDPSIYTVAWFTPLEIETRAALYMLDEVHDGEFADSGDYSYIAGGMCEYNVVIATFATDQTYGNVSAAALTSHTKSVFRNIKVGLLVGIATGLPPLLGSPLRDIRLGDILVAKSEGDRAAVGRALRSRKEHGRWFPDFESRAHCGSDGPQDPRRLCKARARGAQDTGLFVRFFDKMKHEEHNEGDNGGDFDDPGQGQDQLYAIRAEQVDTVIYLLDFLPPRHIDQRGECGQTLLYTVCFCTSKGGSEEEPGLKLVKALIEHGADLRKPSYTDHDYPLHYAITEAHMPLIKVLCQA